MEKKDIKKIGQEIQEFVITGINYNNIEGLKPFVKELISIGLHDCFDFVFTNTHGLKKGSGVHNILVTIDNINNVSLTWCDSSWLKSLKSFNVDTDRKVIKTKIIKLVEHFNQTDYRVVTNDTIWLAIVEKTGDVHFIWNLDGRGVIKTLTSQELTNLVKLIEVIKDITIFGKKFYIDNFYQNQNGNPNRSDMSALTVNDVVRVNNTVLRLNKALTL
jgi:hypothetical protein